MKKLISFLLIAFLTVSVFAQTEEPVDKKAERKKAKQEKKEEEQKKMEKMALLTKQMIEDHQFVLEAQFLNSKNGDMMSVSPELNFIIVDSTTATIQLGSLDGTGFGELGTLTFDGEITKYEVTRTEKKNYSSYDLIMIVFSNLGTYDISLSVSDSGAADAIIRGSGAGSLNYTGTLVPLEESKVFKGRKIY